MRFLYHDQALLEQSFELLLFASKSSLISQSDKIKIESALKMIVNDFYKLNYDRISAKSQNLRTMTD